MLWSMVVCMHRNATPLGNGTTWNMSAPWLERSGFGLCARARAHYMHPARSSAGGRAKPAHLHICSRRAPCLIGSATAPRRSLPRAPVGADGVGRVFRRSGVGSAHARNARQSGGGRGAGGGERSATWSPEQGAWGASRALTNKTTPTPSLGTTRGTRNARLRDGRAAQFRSGLCCPRHGRREAPPRRAAPSAGAKDGEEGGGD